MSRPSLPARITIVEVGPRDGLQNEAADVPTAAKVRFVDDLAAAGLPVVEAVAFVSPRRVPRMADAAAVAAAIVRRPETRYSALVPNLEGLDAARAAGFQEVAIFAAASDTFSRRNINRSVEESLIAYAEVCRTARTAGLRVRGYLSTAFGCPYEGTVPASRVADLADRLQSMGVFEIAVSDTIGVAHPAQVFDVLDAVSRRVDLPAIALHFHDTRGTALANVYAALTVGVTVFDASAGGLGGCPYAPGASGNLATEDLVYLVSGLGIEHGVDLDAVVTAGERLAPHVGHPLPSRYHQAAMAARRAT